MRRRIVRQLPVLLVLTLASFARPVEGQILQRVKEKAKTELEKAVRCKVTDQKCIDAAKKDGKEVVLTDDKGNALPPEQQKTDAAAQQEAAPAALKPGEGAWANYDFVPGERVMFFDDFAKDRVGNFPQRLEFLDGNMEVVQWNGGTWLRANAASAFQVNLPETLPDRFTLEFDLTIPWWGFTVYTGEYKEGGPPSGLEDRAVIVVHGTQAGVIREGRKGESVMDPRTLDPHLYGERDEISAPKRIRFQADGKYLKLYIEENRVANMPSADFVRTNQLIFQFAVSGNAERQVAPLITNISVNAGGSPMYDALVADGRFVTQGILFDTGSERLRPESTPTLNEIAAMLKEHGDLRLRIEGHTDNVGDDASNLALSQKRADSVKQFLVQTAGIDASRLETEGFGETKPVGDNATPEGRQNNRRVELVRLTGQD